MPTIKGTKNETQDISGTGKTWTVAANAVIHGEEMGIYEDSDSADNVLKIFGKVTGVVTEEHPAATAVFTFGARMHMDIAKSATLVGRNGAIAYGDDAVIKNAGKITAHGGLGIEINNFDGAGTVINSGKVNGDTGIYVLGSDIHITNAKTGKVVGQENGVEMLGTSDGHRLTNLGKIIGVAGDGFAILGSEYDDIVINRGTIKGAIDLGVGEDRFEFRGGKVNHAIAGGEGADLLITNKASVRLFEQAADGFDTVRSTVSYVLGDNIEALILLGKKNINGTGAEQGSTLVGNSGANKLIGLDGNDTISGGKGADILTGNEGNDRFGFEKGTGKDTIRDFEDGIDDIGVSGFSGINDTTDIEEHIKQKGDDVWVTLSKKDIMVIKDTDVSLIDHDDFTLLV